MSRRDALPEALLRPGEAQPVDFAVVIDFEATCEQDKSIQEPQEIIEFPAVLVDVRRGCTSSTFQRYVRPVWRPRLSQFCMELTGITQATVDNAQPFPSALQGFVQWLEECGLDPNTCPQGSLRSQAAEV
eukprot:RCo045776